MSDISQQLQTALGTSYDIERELGGGGMSRVFVATETALGRRVVIKVLTPELAQGMSAERFAREIKLAAALQDPHIVPVLSAGDAGGLPYYTMPFVEGESLRARLLRGTLTYNESIGVLRDVAMALEYAHARGVIHRDIKPENVLLAGRTAVVADFGIAKALSAARTMAPGGNSGGTLTSIGQSLGTPAYMAPEQAAGDPVDSRSDLYAWGVMAYELLAGRHPFADKVSAAQLMAAHVTETPVSLAEKRPGLPPPVAALVMQCLSKDPGARPQTASDIVQALDAVNSPSGAGASLGAAAAVGRPRTESPTARSVRESRVPVAAIALGVVLVVGAGGFFYARRGASASSTTTASETTPSGAASEELHAIAVLPFENLGDSANAYFADGITDAVRSKLVSLQGVRVIARGSSNQYRGSTKTPSDIAKELGVRYLLTGAVRFATTGGSSRVQVSPELVEMVPGGTPQTRWSEPFDAEVKDVFKVQGDIASKVAASMQVALGGSEQQQLARTPTRDPAAYDAYLRGQATWNYGANNDPATLRRAIGYFEKAGNRDPMMLEAWTELARSLSLLYGNQASPDPQIGARVQEAAQRAFAIDSNSAEARRALASYYYNVNNDIESARRELDVARRIAPRDPAVIAFSSTLSLQLGQLDQSLRDRQLAVTLDPRSASAWNQLGAVLSRLRRFDEARIAADRAIALAPSAPAMVEGRVLIELSAGDLAAARRVISRATQDNSPTAVVAYVATYWDLGWVLDDAQSKLLLTLGPDAFDNDFAAWALVRAQQYLWLGDRTKASAWGDTASRYVEIQKARIPLDPQVHALAGFAAAFVGRKDIAAAEGEKGVAMAIEVKDLTVVNYLRFLLARSYLMSGDRAKAMDNLEQILRSPYFVTPGWLRIDPTWKELKGDPRFEKMIAAS